MGGTLDLRSRNRLVAAWLGALVGVLGAIVVAGWHLRAPVLVQLNPSWVPMQYNTAWSLVALGLGILALSAGMRRTGAVLGIVPLGIGAITLASWVFDLYPGIDELFFRHYITIFTPSPGRMSPNTAFSFILAGAALAIAGSWPRPAHAVVCWTLGIVVAVCGFAGGIWSLLYSSVPGESVRFTYMAAHAGFAFMLAGTAITVLAAYGRAALPPVDRVWGLPVAAALAVTLISLVLWQASAIAEDRRIRTDMREALGQIAAALQTDGVTWKEAFTRAARRATREADALPAGAWEMAAQDYFRGNGWLREIVWFEPDGSVRHSVPRDPAEPLPKLSPLHDAEAGEAFRRSLETLEVQLLRPHAGGKAVSEPLGYFLAPFESGATRGVLAFTARLDTLFREAIGEMARGYDARIFDAGRPVFARLEAIPASGRRDFGSERQGIDVYGRRWMLEVRPGPEILTRLSTVLPQLTLLFGLVLSALLAVALRYAGMARLRTAGIISTRSLLEREVDERRRAELYARSSEERARLALAEMQQILNQSQDLICTFDLEGRFVLVSPSSWKILGYRPEEMAGRRWEDFVFVEDHPQTAEETATLRAGKVTRDFENRFVHRNGSLVSLSWSAAWVADAQTCYAIARDVTRRNRQEALRESQRNVLQLIATAAPLEVTLREICASVERTDPSAFCSVLLLDADGRMHTGAAPRLPPGYVQAIEGLPIGPSVGSCGTAMWRKEPVIVEDIDTDPLWAVCRSLGQEYGLRACWSMPIIAAGKVLGSFAIYRRQPGRPEAHEIEMIEAAAGMTAIAIEREQAQARLLENREQLEFARRLAQLGYWEVYFETGRTLLSAEMLQMLGLDPAVDHDFNELLEFVLEADRPALLAARDATIKADTPVDCETRLVLPDGSLRYIYLRGRAVRRHDGRVVKLAGTVQDITARKLVELENAHLYAELEKRVQSRTRELEQSNRELEAFSYSVSHDLRAPLRAIAGFGALLQDQYGAVLDAQGRHYLERIVAGTVRMSSLIDDLLELGRVSRVEIIRQPLNLSALVASIGSHLQERWPDRTVELEIQPELVVWGDLRLMEVVLENLLDNAWKFTAGRNPARIRVGRTFRDGQEVFFVADNGVGFDPRYASNLFGVFQRLHAASAFPGTGVGLATVQRILQRHGGRIWADAKLDEGATFYFTVSEMPR